MPTKKTKIEDSENSETTSETEAKPKAVAKPAAKPRKKVVKKTKDEEGPDLSSLPNNAAPVQMDSVAPISADVLHNKQAVNEDFAEKREAMRDIKPREHARKADADFLVPEKFNFDFNKGQHRPVKTTSSTMHKVAYVLIVLIILMLGGLYYLNNYSTKMVAGPDNVAVDNSQDNSTTDVTPSTYTLSLAGVPSDIKSLLVSSLTNTFGSGWGYSDYTQTIPTVTTDTLFVKESGKDETTQLLTALANLGIKPEIQQVSDLQTGAVLYLTPTVAKPDLSGLVASVANASGVTGAAKKYCATLTNYKATSCQAINATANQTGTTVGYKTPKVVFILKRTPEFQKATFVPADSKQIEDIKVTLGK